MQTTVEYTCIDNDTEIEVVIEDGEIDSLFVRSVGEKWWKIISIDDLQAAIQLANDEIKDQDRIEMKLT